MGHMSEAASISWLPTCINFVIIYVELYARISVCTLYINKIFKYHIFAHII